MATDPDASKKSDTFETPHAMYWWVTSVVHHIYAALPGWLVRMFRDFVTCARQVEVSGAPSLTARVHGAKSMIAHF